MASVTSSCVHPPSSPSAVRPTVAERPRRRPDDGHTGSTRRSRAAPVGRPAPGPGLPVRRQISRRAPCDQVGAGAVAGSRRGAARPGQGSGRDGTPRPSGSCPRSPDGPRSRCRPWAPRNRRHVPSPGSRAAPAAAPRSLTYRPHLDDSAPPERRAARGRPTLSLRWAHGRAVHLHHVPPPEGASAGQGGARQRLAVVPPRREDRRPRRRTAPASRRCCGSWPGWTRTSPARPILAPGATVGLLPQEPELDATKDVRGNIEQGVAEHGELLRRFEEIGARLGEDRARRDGGAARRVRRAPGRRSTPPTRWDLDRKLEIAMDALRCRRATRT